MSSTPIPIRMKGRMLASVVKGMPAMVGGGGGGGRRRVHEGRECHAEEIRKMLR